MRPSEVDLDAIARLDELVQGALDGALTAGDALTMLTEIETKPLVRPWPLLVGAYGVAGAAVATILGGHWREAAAAASVGLLAGGVALIASRTARAEPMVAPVAGVVASFFAVVLARLGLSPAIDIVTLGALVTFLPGMRLTIGMRELSTNHLQSGVGNTASALVQLLGLVFGVGIGRSIASNWLEIDEKFVPDVSFSPVHLLAAVAAGLAFTLTLRARYRDALLMCGATVLALGAREVGEELVGVEAAVFVAALAVGVAGGVVCAKLRLSPLIFIVPGVLMLVPGSAGLRSAMQLLADQTVSGIAAAFDTFVTAMSIAYGLIVATVVLPRRFTQIGPRSAPHATSRQSPP
jgi:uncharacterized membrane protein YjjP (DUF1212 family)